jgi:TP901 family phage tail tape measure protein
VAAKTIYQRIALQGGEQLRKELAEFGEVGEKAFLDLQRAVTKTQAPLDKLLSQLARTQKQMMAVGKSFTDAGREIQSVGRSLTTYITAPILGVGAAILKTAGDFEAGVNNFVANTGAVGESLDAAKQKALDLGAASVFSSSEAIDAMTELAKVGRSYEEIMGGAADATLALAAANGGELTQSAAIVGDVMNQFGLKAEDLKNIVNSISGTLIESKLDFDGYRLALGQAGGAAGALGVELEDFNSVLAVTSSSFSSGSDAGTSFKAFLQRLVPQSKEAQEVFDELGLSFFDSSGNMKSMAQIAEVLRTRLRPTRPLWQRRG